MSKDSVMARCVFIYVCSLSLTDFLLCKFHKAISSILKGLFSLSSWFSLLECLCMSLHVFLFTKALLSREELFRHFRNGKLSPGVEADLKSNLGTWHGRQMLLRFQESLNFSDIRVNLMHNHHKLLEVTLVSYLLVCFIFLPSTGLRQIACGWYFKDHTRHLQHRCVLM